MGNHEMEGGGGGGGGGYPQNTGILVVTVYFVDKICNHFKNIMFVDRL